MASSPTLGLPRIKPTLQPDYNLWVSLVGGDGRWRQRKAEEEWARQLVEHAERLKEQRLEEEKRRAKLAKEAERLRRKQEEELRLAEERKRAEEARRREEERLRREKEEEERRRRMAEEREKLRWVKRKCKVCNGSGLCRTCDGQGALQTYYLAATVNGPSASEYGCRPRGCEACGGLPFDWGHYRGSGKCDGCNGARMIRPPPEGWQSPPPGGWPE